MLLSLNASVAILVTELGITTFEEDPLYLVSVPSESITKSETATDDVVVAASAPKAGSCITTTDSINIIAPSSFRNFFILPLLRNYLLASLIVPDEEEYSDSSKADSQKPLRLDAVTGLRCGIAGSAVISESTDSLGIYIDHIR